MKNTLTHLVSVVFLAIISVAYFYPVLSGKSIQQSDISQFMGHSGRPSRRREDVHRAVHRAGVGS